jgi:hypothetical protein
MHEKKVPRKPQSVVRHGKLLDGRVPEIPEEEALLLDIMEWEINGPRKRPTYDPPFTEGTRVKVRWHDKWKHGVVKNFCGGYIPRLIQLRMDDGGGLYTGPELCHLEGGRHG